MPHRGLRKNGRLSRLASASSIVALTFSLNAASAIAAVTIGGTEQVVNEVQGFLGRVTRVLEVQDEVFSEEVIETADDGATRIIFLDGSELTMGANSRVTLDRFVFDPDAGDGSMVVNLVSGVFEFASGLIPSSGYDLRTPFANLAIRGTVIRLGVFEDGHLEVIAREGTVTVTGPGGTVVLDNPSNCAVLYGGDQLQVLGEGECSQLQDAIAQTLAALSGALVEPGAGPDDGTDLPSAIPIDFSPNGQTRLSIEPPEVASPSTSQAFR
jgi:hypothetical protein